MSRNEELQKKLGEIKNDIKMHEENIELAEKAIETMEILNDLMEHEGFKLIIGKMYTEDEPLRIAQGLTNPSVNGKSDLIEGLQRQLSSIRDFKLFIGYIGGDGIVGQDTVKTAKESIEQLKKLKNQLSGANDSNLVIDAAE